MADTTSGTIASTVASLPSSAAARFGPNVAARFKRGDQWVQLSYAEFVEAVDEIALGLVDLGIERGDRVCLLAETRVEWSLASFGISAAGAVAVPVYPTNSPSECEWVAGNSGARAIFCENRGQLAKLEEVRGGLPDLAHVIGIEDDAGEITLEQLRSAAGPTTAPSSPPARSRSAPRTPTRSSTRRARPARPRESC